MVRLDESLVVHGDIEAHDDLLIEGRVRGHIRSDRAVVTVSEGAEITGDIVARAISVAGQVIGTITATELVEIGPTANVKARVIADRFVLCDGAIFNGDVHSQKLDAAASLARYRSRQTA